MTGFFIIHCQLARQCSVDSIHYIICLLKGLSELKINPLNKSEWKELSINK